MKRSAALTTILLLCISVAHAQQDSVKHKYYIPKGTKLMTGGISFGFHKSDNVSPGETRSVNLSVTEQSGYFLANNLAMGILVRYEFAYSKEVLPLIVPPGEWIRRNYRHTVAPGIFLRYYKMFTPGFGLFGQFDAGCILGFNRTRSNDPLYNVQDRTIGFSTGISPRLLFFATPKLAIEAGFGSLRYDFVKDVNSADVYHSGGFSLNPNLHFGLSFYFGKGVQAKAK